MRRATRFSQLVMSIAASFLSFGLLSAQQSPMDTSQTHALHSAQGESPPADDAAGEVESPDMNGQLIKAVQNPVARLISIPFQSNSSFNVGPYGRTPSVLNFQPVIPLPLSENWNLIIRMIQPIVRQPYLQQSSGGEYGFGDMNPTIFLAPARPGRLIWVLDRPCSHQRQPTPFLVRANSV